MCTRDAGDAQKSKMWMDVGEFVKLLWRCGGDAQKSKMWMDVREFVKLLCRCGYE